MSFKVADYQWEHPGLQKYMRELTEGQFLFRQGQQGRTMFIIVRGAVALYARRDGKDYLLDVLEAGEFLGEKSVMNDRPHLRFFSAQARSDMRVLEIGLKELHEIEAAYPQIMTDLLKRMFLIAAGRLDRANQMIAALRSSNNVERFVKLLLQMAHGSAQVTPYGQEIFVNMDRIRYFVDMTRYEIESCMATLEKSGILVKQAENSYVLKSVEALEEATGALLDNLPTLKAI